MNKEQLPTIPTPHDCVLADIKIENQSIVFKFEEDISYYDSIKAIRPDAKSLIIRYHLVDEESFSVYKWHKPVKIFASNGYYTSIDNFKLTSLATNKIMLEYLYHNVGYCSIITKLYSG